MPEPVIEKDYYVTQVIHALSNIENKYFRLVFCGGTCLAKAHKVVQRNIESLTLIAHRLEGLYGEVTFAVTLFKQKI